MAASTRPKPEQGRAGTHNIPTLTDIARPAAGSAPAEKKAPPATRRATPAGDSSHRKALEKLIYKRLHQRLPQLAQELAAEILQDVEQNGGSGKNRE